MYRTIILVAIILLVKDCFGQRPNSADESLVRITNEVMRMEISSFNIKGTSLIEGNTQSKIKLEKIPVRRCSDDFALFEKGNIYDSDLIVNIKSDSSNSITEIRLLYGRYGQYFLPDRAIKDIYHAKFCDLYTKRGKPIKSNSKVFRSEDKKRVYIYMLNGNDEDHYEVTWIIQDGKYYARVITLL